MMNTEKPGFRRGFSRRGPFVRVKGQMTMDCKKAKRKLNRYLDGELPVRDRDHVEQHLRGCLSCRNELERLRGVAGAMATLPEPPEVPVGFAERVMNRAARDRAGKGLLLTFWQSVSPPMRIAAAAMVVLGICLGAVMSRDVLRGQDPATDVAVTELDTSYGFDYLTDAPDGSLADSYLALAAGTNGGGK